LIDHEGQNNWTLRPTGWDFPQKAASKCLQGYAWVPMQSWDTDFSRFCWDCVA